MPGTDGVELGKAIKADATLRNSRIIMLISRGLRGDAARMKDIGFSAYLTKPLRRSQLFDCLSTVLSNAPEGSVSTDVQLVTRHTIADETRRKLRILVAEDNKTNLKLVQRLLEKIGYHADGVANGEEAVKTLEMVPYDIVLMDIQMPQMDGIEATRIIREPQSKVRNHQVFIVAMTALAMEGDRQNCLDAGMDNYISKPINTEELFNIIEGYVLGSDNSDVGFIEDDVTENKIIGKSIIDHDLVLNWDELLIRLDGDEDLAKDLLQEFIKDVPVRLERLAKAVEINDAPAVAGEAHSIKGASKNISAKALSDTSDRLELAGKHADHDSMQSLVAQLTAGFDELKTTWSEIRSLI